MRRVFVLLVLVAVLAALLGLLAGRGCFGRSLGAGEVTNRPRAAPLREAAERAQDAAATRIGVAPGKQILFGDLHAHTTFSFDAFSISLPMVQGEGAHPPADACDFARFCAGLDFWSINDHAEGLTPEQWRETRDSVRDCNEAAGDPSDPDLVTFLGWEWTQIGATPDEHYGHKNVILRDLRDEAVPARPIASRRQLFPGDANPYGLAMRLALIVGAPGGGGRQPYHDFARFLQEREDNVPCEAGVGVRALPSSCSESAETPTQLFEKLDDWGFPYLVIPHGNTWGFYTPPLTSWDKQLADHRTPNRHERLIEVFSGHGNTEQYRDWRALERGPDGQLRCPEPRASYTPECWQAGEIIRSRCNAVGESEAECERRAAEARKNHVAAGDRGYLTVPGSKVEDWLDAGQCRDCYMPAYAYRPGGSVQYALALRDFEDPEAPKRFRFGLIASSDVHSARPGTGYKELQRRKMTDAALGLLGPPPILRAREPAPRSITLEEAGDLGPYFERFASFFGTGGLVAAHSAGRDRDAIWQALQRKEVYGTSGDKILLWFDLMAEDGRRAPMGSDVLRSTAPRFEVRALGSFAQKPGCPPETASALAPERLARLCGGECDHPSDRRKAITRIEVVRIRPRVRADEPIAATIEDPWRVLPCPAEGEGCSVRFSDPDFAAGHRDAVYYVRAIEEASPTINGDALRCARDEQGRCLEVRPCYASDPTASTDECLSLGEERAWSSPIFVDYDGARGG